MIDQKMRKFVQSYINIDTKINDLWNLCSILKSTYGEDAGKINIRDLFCVTVEPKPVELLVPRRPIGLGVEVKWSPDAVDNIIRERERKVVKPAVEPGVLSGHKCNKPWCGTCQPDVFSDGFKKAVVAHKEKCGALLLQTIYNELRNKIFIASEIMSKKDCIHEAFQNAGLSLECVLKTWTPVNMGLVLHGLAGKAINGLVLEEVKDRKRWTHYRIRQVDEQRKPSFEEARKAQATRNPPSPRTWENSGITGMETKPPPAENAYYNAKDYRSFAARILDLYRPGERFTIEDVRLILKKNITAIDFGRIKMTKIMKGRLRGAGYEGNKGIYEII